MYLVTKAKTQKTKKWKKLNKTEQTEKYDISELEIITFLGENFRDLQGLQFHM